MTAGFAKEPPEPWLNATVAAFRAALDARSAQAADGWSQAGSLSASFKRNDPRIATACHNVAVAMLIEGHYECAVQNFCRARASWENALKWIDVVDIPLAGRGSTFHFKLAAEHSDVFTRVRRHRLVELCLGACAITNVLNRLARHLMQAESLVHSEFEADVSAITAAFGGACPEIDLVCQVRDGTMPVPETSKPSLFERWLRDPVQSSAQLTDFYAAVFLIAGLHSKHLPWKDCIGRGGPLSALPAIPVRESG